MKFSNKLFLPVLALSLVAPSAFAEKNPISPFGNLALRGLAIAAGAYAYYYAIETSNRGAETHSSESYPIQRLLLHMMGAALWVDWGYEAIQNYQEDLGWWEFHEKQSKLRKDLADLVAKKPSGEWTYVPVDNELVEQSSSPLSH